MVQRSRTLGYRHRPWSDQFIQTDTVSLPQRQVLWEAAAHVFEGQIQQMSTDEAVSGKDTTTLLLAENLRNALGRFVRSVRTQADTPTTSQSETLSLLEKSGPMSIADLASQRSVRHQSMRLVTIQLEAEDLVCKVMNPADRRSQLLSITEKGREQLALSREARTSKIAELIDDRLSDAERRTLEAAILVIQKLC